jgi:hypothetical protein
MVCVSAENRGERRGTHAGLHRLDGDRVAVQVVGRDDLEAVRSKVVREQLCSPVSQDSAGGGAARTLLLLRAMPKTSVRKRRTLSFGYSPEGVAT